MDTEKPSDEIGFGGHFDDYPDALPPSREPGQAGVTDGKVAEWLARMDEADPVHMGDVQYPGGMRDTPRMQGSEETHTIIRTLIADRTRYREVLRLWNDHLPGCSGSPRCECGYAEARALLEEVQDATQG